MADKQEEAVDSVPTSVDLRFMEFYEKFASKFTDKHDETVDSIAKAVALFSTDFHKNVASKVQGNFVSSALSAHTSLSMAAYGADGTTAEVMRKCLHLPDPDDYAQKGFQGFIDTINEIQNAVVKVANKMYVSTKTSINDKFKDIISTYFRSESDTLNFDKSVKSAQVINSWCEKKTDGKITEIISPSHLNSEMTMILINAIYFKANWSDAFCEEDTKLAPFHVDKSTTIDVPTMNLLNSFHYCILKEVDAQYIALPYASDDLYMIIIIPNQIDGLEKVEKNLESIEFNYKNFMSCTGQTILSLPKFKVESTLELNDHLSEMGLAEIFSDKANFKNISDKPVKVSKVVQKAFIEVNEKGCEAGAFTVLQIVPMSGSLHPRKFKVNRPFYYRIVHRNTTLFSGRVMNPLLTQA